MTTPCHDLIGEKYVRQAAQWPITALQGSGSEWYTQASKNCFKADKMFKGKGLRDTEGKRTWIWQTKERANISFTALYKARDMLYILQKLTEQNFLTISDVTR